MRQTNAVWVLFIAGTMMLTLVERMTHFRYFIFRLFLLQDLKKLFFHYRHLFIYLHIYIFFHLCIVMIVFHRDSTIPSIWVIVEFLQNLLYNLPYLLRETWPMLMPILSFLVFVVINKGIVIGKRKSEHIFSIFMTSKAQNV
jgi:DIE2/ALG10 family